MLKSAFELCRRFASSLDDRGNVALVAALSMAPICVAGLGAADLARATSAKSQLQDALDTAALAAARTNATTDAELKTYGDRYLAQNLKLSSDATVVASSFRFADNGRVVATATVAVRPFVAGLVTGGDMAINATSEVVRAGVKVEVALVLDTTGSMTEGDKLDDMKDAAQAFVLKMKTASGKAIEPNTIKISVVPFANTVRVDEVAYRNSTWVDQNGAAPINDQIFTTATGTQHASRFTLFSNLGTSWRGCFEMREAPYDVQDDPPTVSNPATLYTPYFAPDEPDSRTEGYGNEYGNSYVRDYPKGAKDTSSNWRVRQGLINKYGNEKLRTIGITYGPNADCGVSRLRRLTTDFDSLIDYIDDLEANGNTNIPIGLMWGWNTLTPHAPFSDGVGYNTPKHKKIIVLMTDGENTMSRRDTPNDGEYAGTGYIWQQRILTSDGTPLQQGATSAQRTQALDARLRKLCDNIKAKGIDLYTIRVEVDTGTNELLKSCASGRDYFYDVHSSSTLTTVFESIAGQIAALHLSR
jgi:Flp pilus assembly protein TadG